MADGKSVKKSHLEDTSTETTKEWSDCKIKSFELYPIYWALKAKYARNRA